MSTMKVCWVKKVATTCLEQPLILLIAYLVCITQTASSVKKSVLESLANPDRKVRRVFATQLLSMGINCQIFVASITGVYQDHWSSTSKKLEGGVGMVLPRKRSCYSVIHNLNTNFGRSLQLIIARVIHAYE